MTLSRTSAITSDPFIIMQEYNKVTAENASLVKRLKSVDVENRCLKETALNQINEMQKLSLLVQQLEQIVMEIDPLLLDQIQPNLTRS